MVSRPNSFLSLETISSVLARVLPMAPYVTDTNKGFINSVFSTAWKKPGHFVRSSGGKNSRETNGFSLLSKLTIRKEQSYSVLSIRRKTTPVCAKRPVAKALERPAFAAKAAPAE
jgi:hypothetical protein